MDTQKTQANDAFFGAQPRPARALLSGGWASGFSCLNSAAADVAKTAGQLRQLTPGQRVQVLRLLARPGGKLSSAQLWQDACDVIYVKDLCEAAKPLEHLAPADLLDAVMSRLLLADMQLALAVD